LQLINENRVRPDSTAFEADLTVAALRAAAIGRPRASLNIVNKKGGREERREERWGEEYRIRRRVEDREPFRENWRLVGPGEQLSFSRDGIASR
jgi:hypothetical protein